MTDNHPCLDNLRSTGQLLKEATTSFKSNLFTFLFLSFLVLSFRVIVENGTQYVPFFIDRDPSLKALLSRLEIASDQRILCSFKDPSISPAVAHRQRRQHRCSFMHLTRVGILDYDIFSEDGDDERTLFYFNQNHQSNYSFVFFTQFNLISVFSDLVVDDGIRVSEVYRSRVGFKARSSSFSNDEETVDDEEENERSIEGKMCIRIWIGL